MNIYSYILQTVELIQEIERGLVMNKFTEYIGSQFGNPRGFIGKVCCVLMNIINKAMYKNTVSVIGLSSDENILDIGYGNGYLLKCVYKKTKANLYGIDISEDMKIQATKRNKKALSDGKLFLDIGDCCDSCDCRIFIPWQSLKYTTLNKDGSRSNWNPSTNQPSKAELRWVPKV